MLKILGDLNLADGYFDLGYGVGTAIKQNKDPLSLLQKDESDFWIGNLECVIADCSDKIIPFVIDPVHAKKIKHLNLYGVANNHVMQIGENGFNQTINFLEANHLLYAGTKSKKSVTFSHQGKKVGLISFSQRPDNFSSSPLYWHIPELTEIKKEIEKLSDCDYKIAFIHWGYEFINYPNIDQKILAHWLVDCGIDLVAGMHPHVAQGIEEYNGGIIAYSLGNSVFKMNWEPTRYGLMLTVDLEMGTVKKEYIMINEDGFPKVAGEKLVPVNYTLDNLNDLLSIQEENEVYFNKAAQYTITFRKNNHKCIIKDILSGRSPYAKNIIKDYLNRRLLKK